MNQHRQVTDSLAVGTAPLANPYPCQGGLLLLLAGLAEDEWLPEWPLSRLSPEKGSTVRGSFTTLPPYFCEK